MRNVIEGIVTSEMTKQRLIDAINEAFPDDEVSPSSAIAVLTTTRMTDGTTMQAFTFGKQLKL